uniref:Uncharacterized protein n=1 Tax=Anguilla anguilla TaxID=7936 RepID=A0A0E9W4D2_ANGAN
MSNGCSSAHENVQTFLSRVTYTTFYIAVTLHPFIQQNIY